MRTIIDANPAARLAKDLVAYVNTRDHAHIAVSGGSTPRALFNILASDYRTAARWDRVTIWQVDERTVPPTDSQSNWKMLSEALLSQISNLKSHRMEAERENAADDYEAMVRGEAPHATEVACEQSIAHVPQLDLVLLGMGDDGHTASLFPGSPVDVDTPTIAVTAHYQDRPANRVSLTPKVFNQAREIWFLVTGAGKAEILRRVIRGERNPKQLPAQRIQPVNGNLVWMIDDAAGSLL